MAFKPSCINYSPTEKLRCLVKIGHIIFPKKFTPGDWAICSASIEEVYEGDPYSTEIKIKGRAYSLDIGGVYQLTGTIDDHPDYGFSYDIVSFAKEFSTEDAGHRRMYLESLFTEKQVEAMYNKLPDPYKVFMDHDAATLCKVKGIGPSTARKMISRFHDDYAKSRAYVALGKYDLTVNLIDSLIRRFHGDIDKLLFTVNENPYIMMFEVDGIGWKKADQIAVAKGIKPDDLIRFEANIIHQLNQITEQGNTWVTPAWLVSAVLTDMGLSFEYADKFREALYSLHEKHELWWDDEKTKIALYKLRKLEENIAKELYRIASGAPLEPRTQEPPDVILRKFEEETGFDFTEEQRSAIMSTLQNNVSIITGGAGTGKSTSVRGVLKVLEGCTFAQCALSGRAAARLSEVTGQGGSTIHRLLKADDSGFGFYYKEDNPLPYDIIILDEVSMVGAEIFLDLLKAIGDHTKLIMLGDDGQLESIGLCNLFKDMLDSEVVTVSRLTKIHRQAAKSAIITESVKVRNKEPIIDYDWVGEETRGELQDLKLVVYDDAILSQDTVVEQYQALLDEGISYNDIQIVLPMKQRGMLCTYTLNQRIQELVNPPKHGIEGILVGATKTDKSHAYYLRKNDRVIVTKNMYHAQKYVPWNASAISEPNYDTSLAELLGEYDYDEVSEEDLTCAIYNGDRGIILEIDGDGMVVEFDQWGEIYIKREEFRNVELGYALSCHKLQGSEAPYVIVGLDMSGRILLTKEWLYTAITRAKKHCIVCGESRAISYANNNSNISIKQTMLKDLLIETFKGGI